MGNPWVLNIASQLIAAGILITCGFIFRAVRKYFIALNYIQRDLSTIWVALELKPELRSGSYRFPRYSEEPHK